MNIGRIIKFRAGYTLGGSRSQNAEYPGGKPVRIQPLTKRQENLILLDNRTSIVQATDQGSYKSLVNNTSDENRIPDHLDIDQTTELTLSYWLERNTIPRTK